jgi:hypothetical protein
MMIFWRVRLESREWGLESGEWGIDSVVEPGTVGSGDETFRKT